jgi:tetratricopeptide (TPR) repeat protein/uncharacterized protein with HEPN domain
MSFYFLREWSQFNSQNWVNPDPEFVKNKESHANSLSEVVLPVFVELSKAPTLSVELEKTYENRFKRRLTNLQGLEEGKRAALQQIDWKSSTIVEDLRVIDPAFAKVWEEFRISSEEEKAQREAALFSSGNGEHIFLQSLVYYMGKNDNRFVSCLKKLMELPSYKDEALRVLLMHYKETQQFDVIEAMTNSVVESERELEQETVLLLVYSQIQVLIRKKAYDEALTRLDKVRPLSDNSALFDALRAQILLKKHVAGQSIADVCEYMELALRNAKEFPLTAGWMLRAFTELKVEFAVFMGHPLVKGSSAEVVVSEIESSEIDRAIHHDFKEELKDALLIYENCFFSAWCQANPHSYKGDRSLSESEKGYVTLYVRCLFKCYKNEWKVYLHLQKLLDSFVIPTRWKQSFAEIAERECINQSLISSSKQMTESFQLMADSFISLSKKMTEVHKKVGVKKPNLTKRFETNETIAKYLNLFGLYPRKSGSRDISIQQEITDFFCDAFKNYLRRIVEDFYRENEAGFEKLSFAAHCKKAKSEKNFALAMMHFIGMIIAQTGRESDTVIEEVQIVLSNLIYLDNNHKALLTLCALSINDFRCELDYPKLHEKFPLEVFLFRGFNHVREKNFEAALKNFNDAYKNDPNHPLVLLGIATCRLYKKDLVIAAMFFQKLVRIDQGLADQAALYAMACLRDANDHDGIRKFLFGMKEMNFQPSREVKIFARYLFIELFVCERQTGKALEWLEMYADAEPNDPFILIHQALLLLSEHEDGQSIVKPEMLFKKALKVYDHNEWSAPLKATFSLKHSVYLSNRNKYEEASEIAKVALPYTSNEEMFSWIQLYTLIYPKDVLAIPQLRKVTAKGFNENSNCATYLFMAGMSYLACKILDLNKVIHLLKKALAKDPTGSIHAQCYIFMLMVYYKKGSDLNGAKQHSIDPPAIFVKLTEAILSSSKSQSDLTLLFESKINLHYAREVSKQWLRKYHHLPFTFSNFAEALKKDFQPDILKILKELETEFSENPNFLTAIAMLETSAARRHYINRCLSLDAEYEPLHCLIARDLYAQDQLEAVEEFERAFRYAHKKTQPEFYFANEKFSNETSEDVVSYVKSVYRKYPDGGQARKYIKQFLNSFNDHQEWTENFRKKMTTTMESLIPKAHSSKPPFVSRSKETVQVEPIATEMIKMPINVPSTPTVVSPAPVQQATLPARFLEPDQEELDLQTRLKKEKEHYRKHVVNLLDVADITLEKRSRIKEEEIIKNVRKIAERCRLTQEEEPVVLLQPKVRERYIPIEQKEVVVPIATTILTQAKPAAASKDYHQEIFALIPDIENDRLNQAYSHLGIIEALLTRVEKPEYHPDVQEFIMQRALMYQLLRLGEALFPQSVSVRKTLSPNYQLTMEKLISSTGMPDVRNQLRHEYMIVTLAKVLNTCRYLIGSNLRQNLKLWHDYNQKPHNVSALVKTILPDSCHVVDPSVRVIPLAFVGTELRKLGSLLDKISVDVLAMNPDIVYAVKMSVCILCEMAKREEFKGKIKGLEQFILAGNKIAHEFGEDCELYSSDEISLFDIRPYVTLAREFFEINFPKSTGTLSAKAPAFVMGKKT